MTSSGYYLMHRGWQDNPVFRGEEFSRRDAFVWMIEEASYRTRRIAVPKGELTLKRGQFSHSLRFMAKAWKWDEARVRRFLSSLSKAKIIDASTDAGQTVVTICNYTKYQALPNGPDAPNDAATTQQRRGGDANENEGNTVIIEDDDDAGAKPQPAAPPLPDPFGPIGATAARLTSAGGVNVQPHHKRFPDQLDVVRHWITLGLDLDTELIPALEQAVVDDPKDRHSLKAFDPLINRLAAQKKAQTNGRQRQPRAQSDLRGARPDPALDLLYASRAAIDREERASRDREDRERDRPALPSGRAG